MEFVDLDDDDDGDDLRDGEGWAEVAGGRRQLWSAPQLWIGGAGGAEKAAL